MRPGTRLALLRKWGLEVVRSSSARALPCLLAAIVVAFASLSVIPSPARGDTNEGGTAVEPANRTKQAKISAGERATCAVIGSASTLWCWGDNTNGLLGDGTSTSSSSPVRVPGLSGVTAVSVGTNHACALLSGGSARCWGLNDAGQLGTGAPSAPQALPQMVSGGHSFLTISAGTDYTCGTTSFQVLCWGSNLQGQLGNGTTTPSAAPTPSSVPGPVKSVSAGKFHTCAIGGGTNAYCWGANNWGQLGLGYTSGPRLAGQLVTSLFNVDAITVGELHTCAIAGGGTKCWGNNNHGQLGNGQPGAVSVPTNIANGNTLEQAISAGAGHTCTRLPSQLRCWGTDGQGQLGNGPGFSSSVPVTVPGYAAEIPAVTTGTHHTCVQLALGRVECFGVNASGQLGNGTQTDSQVPVRAMGLPGSPTAVKARVSAYGSITVDWTPPADTGGIPVKNYRIYDQQGTLSRLVPGDATSETFEFLPSGQTYDLVVAAVNEVGEGQGVQHAPLTTPTLPAIAISDVSYAEGNSGTKNMTFTLTRSGPLGAAVSVKAATQDGNASVPAAATAPSDYTAKAATTVSFAAGQSTKTFVVATRGDLLTEDDESFHVVLSAPVGAEVIDGLAVGTLTNDDAGEKPAYAISNATLVEGNASTTNMTFTITRTGSTAVAGSVKYFTQTIGQATAPADFTARTPTAISFPVGVTSKTFTVAIKGDLVAEPDEYFQVGLSDGVNGDLPSFPYGYGLIVNDDSNATPSVSINDVTTTEGDGFSKNVTFTVTRSGNLAGTTSLKFITQNGTAIAPGDYTAKALTSLSFAAGQTSKTIVVTLKSDGVAEPDETFSVVLSTITGGVIADGTGTGTILNDD